MRHILYLAASAAMLLGCSSDLEKYKDEICACRDRPCIEHVRGSWETRGDPFRSKRDAADDAEAKLRAEIESCTARAMESYEAPTN